MRINAALALSFPTHRKVYGDHFIQLWKSLLTALENARNVTDFNEYNHKEQLIEQVKYYSLYFMLQYRSLSLCHFRVRMFVGPTGTGHAPPTQNQISLKEKSA